MRETLLQALQQAVKDDPEHYPESLASQVNGLVIKDEIVDTGRWTNIHSVIFERAVTEESKEYVKGNYAEGATEYQDDTPPEWEFVEVVPHQVVRIEYKVKR